jgi:tetratricopeptide (TPR) repeat protein
MNQTSLDSLHRIGVSWRAQGRYEEALSAFDEMIKLMPSSEVAHNSLGITLRLAGRFEDALQAYSAAMDIAGLKTFYTLRNSADAALVPWRDIPGVRWSECATKAAIQAAARDGFQSVCMPTLEFALAEENTKKHAGLFWEDSQTEKGTQRLYLPNYFHTFREELAQTQFFSRLLNNIGGALMGLGNNNEAEQALNEAIYFAPEGNSFEDPHIALRMLHRNN